MYPFFLFQFNQQSLVDGSDSSVGDTTTTTTTNSSASCKDINSSTAPSSARGDSTVVPPLCPGQEPAAPVTWERRYSLPATTLEDRTNTATIDISTDSGISCSEGSSSNNSSVELPTAGSMEENMRVEEKLRQFKNDCKRGMDYLFPLDNRDCCGL